MQVETTRLYRVQAVAAMFDVSRATVYREIESGKLPALRFGAGKGALRVSGAAINAYLTRAAVLARQADGLACVVCGADFVTTPVAHVPVGNSDTGSQLFACVGACAEQTVTSPVSASPVSVPTATVEV